jgi:hypothetical protein
LKQKSSPSRPNLLGIHLPIADLPTERLGDNGVIEDFGESARYLEASVQRTPDLLMSAAASHRMSASDLGEKRRTAANLPGGTHEPKERLI